jgi:hypothetical protein
MTFTFTAVVKARAAKFKNRGLLYAREVLISRTVAHKKYFTLFNC